MVCSLSLHARSLFLSLYFPLCSSCLYCFVPRVPSLVLSLFSDAFSLPLFSSPLAKCEVFLSLLSLSHCFPFSLSFPSSFLSVSCFPRLSLSLGKATFDTFTHEKPVLMKGLWADGGLLSDPYFIYPPWTDAKEGIVKNLFKAAKYLG